MCEINKNIKIQEKETVDQKICNNLIEYKSDPKVIKDEDSLKKLIKPEISLQYFRGHLK